MGDGSRLTGAPGPSAGQARSGGRRLPLYVAIFVSGLGAGAAIPILPDIQGAFAVPVSQVVLVTAVWAAFRLLADLPVGFLVDRLRPGRVLVGGTALVAAGGLVSAAAPTFEILLAGRAIAGVGTALVGTGGMVTLLATTDRRRAGRALGSYEALIQAGSAVGQVASGVVAAIAGWPLAFALAGVCAGIATGAVVLRPVHVDPARTPTRGGGAAEDPGGVRLVMRDRWHRFGLLLAIYLVTFMLFFVTGGIIDVALPLFASAEIGLDAAAIGLVLGAATVVRLLATTAGAALSDRFGRLPMILVGVVVMIVGLALVPLATNVVVFAAGAWMVATGRMASSVSVAMLSDMADPRSLGRVIGLSRFVASLAYVSGPIAIGILVEEAGVVPAFWGTGLVVAMATAFLMLAALYPSRRRTMP